ncbi:MAG: TAXI family TRAP transporter solute-binding subunit [Lachnospiraceae bacterium]|nr:TAXI family TRAP transporter solute-binding subunit [Lachnospiraceae bacterium]
MKSRRLAALAMAAAMVTGMLTGCGSSKPAEAPAKTEAAPVDTKAEESTAAEAAAPAGGMEPKTLSFASQSVGSTAYARTAALAQVMNKYLPEGWSVETSPISSGGPAGTLLVEAGECDMGEGINISNKLLVEGKYQDGIEPVKNVSSILGGTDYAYYLIMFTDEFQKKAGVNTLEDLVAQKIPFNLVTKASGSAGELGASQLLNIMGVNYDDITSWGGQVYHIAPNEMADMLKEGRADVSIDIVGLGQAAMSELTLTKTMFFPQLSDDSLKGLADLGYVVKDMPAKSWGGQDNPIKTATNSANITVSNDLPDDLVYAMTKAIVEHKDELVELVPVMEQYDPATSGETSRNGLPLHPGAVKYYEENKMEH